MSSVLETARLRLRRIRDEDVEAYSRWHADEALMRHMGRSPFTRAESEASFARHLAHWDEHGFGILAVEDKQTGELVGRAGLAYHRLWPADPEVGWLIDAPWQGRGLATEAGEASIRCGFDRLAFERIVSICTPENAASRSVMAKLGLRFERELADPELGIPLWLHALARA